MNNELFSLKRFGLALRINWEEVWKPGYCSRLWAPLGVLLLVNLVQFISACNHRMDMLRAGSIGDNFYGFEGTFSGIVEMSSVAYFVILVLSAGCVSLQLAAPRQRVRWLSMPASTLEKYLASLLMSLLFVGVFLPLCFMVTEVIRVPLCSVIYPELDIPWMDYTELLVGDKAYSVADSGETLGIMFTFTSFIFSLFVFGSTLWPKNSQLKTIGALLLVGFVFGWLFYAGVELCFATWGEYASAFYVWGHSVGESITGTEAKVIFHCLFWLASLYFLVLGYYRLKEMELINRW